MKKLAAARTKKALSNLKPPPSPPRWNEMRTVPKTARTMPPHWKAV